MFKRLAKLIGLSGTERLDSINTPYEPGQRNIPSESELREVLLQLDPAHKYSWPTWALATYGCRPSEVYSLQPKDDGTAQVLTVKQKGKPPTWRTAMALPLAPPPGQRSLPLEVKTPGAYDSIEAKNVTGPWGKWFTRRTNGLQLYALRHAWAIRSIKESIPTGLAARCMGHDISVHTKTYHQWLNQADVAAYVASHRPHRSEMGH